MRRFNIFCALVLLTFLVGCSGGKVPLKGTVTYSDDGSPVTHGTVGFLKDGEIARGDIKPDGTYTVGTAKETDGLQPGTYQVFVSGTDKATQISELGSFSYEPLVDKKFENPDTSGLSVEIDASTKTFDIKVDRFKR
jgi:hypothetical protein